MKQNHMVESYFKSFALILLLIFFSTNSSAATVTPIQGGYGNVFPTISNGELDFFRGSGTDPGIWYVDFNLLADANVNVGASAIPGSFKSANLTSESASNQSEVHQVLDFTSQSIGLLLSPFAPTFYQTRDI